MGRMRWDQMGWGRAEKRWHKQNGVFWCGADSAAHATPSAVILTHSRLFVMHFDGVFDGTAFLTRRTWGTVVG